MLRRDEMDAKWGGSPAETVGAPQSSIEGQFDDGQHVCRIKCNVH